MLLFLILLILYIVPMMVLHYIIANHSEAIDGEDPAPFILSFMPVINLFIMAICLILLIPKGTSLKFREWILSFYRR